MEGSEGGNIKKSVEQTMLQSDGIRKKARGFSEVQTDLIFALLKKVSGVKEQREICG